MPIKVRYNNDPSQECVIRPTPFVQISASTLKNKVGNFGVTYSIVLTGTLLPDEGTPYATDPALDQLVEFFTPANTGDLIGPFSQFDNKPFSHRERPQRQKVMKPASAILSKQRALRALFAKDGQTLIITDIFDDAPATVYCNPRVVSIDFTEGPYVTRCDYTINLEADVLLRGDVEADAFIDQGYTSISGSLDGIVSASYDEFVSSSGGLFIEDFNEDWAIEVDDSLGESVTNPRSYRITHNLGATGKKTYGHNGAENKEAWEQARDFVLQRISDTASGNYPNVGGLIGSGTVNLVDTYQGYNHVRTEQIDVSNGSYSVSENWLLSSGTSTENYNATTSTSTTDPFVTVNIDGSIKGLSAIKPSGYSANDISIQTATSGAFANALKKYNEVSNSGKFGLTSDIYSRANNLVSVTLNSQPTSVSLATNEYTGDVTYSLSFNNRPTNIISGVLSEDIQVSDTYPGDIFAVIPVLGRKTGPVLQYIGGRTEYRRDISLNLVMDYTKVPYGSGRESLLLKKPSLVEPTAGQISQLLRELSPAGEPGIRKYFVAPPQENWSPKNGTYSFNISFTYELDK